LEAKLQLLQKQLASLQQNEDYLAAISNNWDDYFAQTQAKLENQIQVLKVEIEKRK
jgi:predicted proteasome-type protease